MVVLEAARAPPPSVGAPDPMSRPRDDVVRWVAAAGGKVLQGGVECFVTALRPARAAAPMV
jgi:hypothetical protein